MGRVEVTSIWASGCLGEKISVLCMDLQLTNKLALVSGSTAGIGLAIATSLAAEGARVIVNGRTEKRVTEAIDSIRKKHADAKLEPFAGDLSTATAAEELARRFPAV